MSERPAPDPLDKTIVKPGWYGISAIVILVIAFLARFIRLDTYLLNEREAHWAYDSWSMFYGRPLPLGEELPDSSPFMLLWNSMAFYLFGVTDATSRVGSALLGVGLVALVFLLRPFFSKAQIVSVAGLLAISPTVVFASRTVEPGIAAAFFALLIIVSLLRVGPATSNHVGWAALLGIGIAGLYATGPLGVTTLFGLIVGLIVAGMRSEPGKISANAIGTSFRMLGKDRNTQIGLLSGLIITLLVLFSRALSSISSLAGIGTTMVDWVDMMARGTSSVPVVFYFWSMMLYETIAVILAIVGVAMMRNGGTKSKADIRPIPNALFIGWFMVALLLHSTASSRDTSSAVLVVLPVLVLAGLGLGGLIGSARPVANARTIVGAVAAVILVAYSLNALIGLSFTRGESGSEPLAHDVPTEEAGDLINRIMRLSRDISVTEYSITDPTGQHSLSIKVTPDQEWPFTWYFRDFDDFSVTPAAGFTAETDVAIASNPDVMTDVGLTTSSTTWLMQPGDPLSMMKSGEILRTGLNPLNWGDAWSYMIHRETPGESAPRSITVGYSARVMNKLTTQSGPFNLFEQPPPGPGGGLGQLELPTGIATGQDGTIYVLNAGNARIDRFQPDGTFIGIWNGQVQNNLQLSWNGMQGGTGIQVGPDGLIYVADTWNHAVIIVNPSGEVVRTLGNRGVQTDITDAGSPTDQPGLFFGPRDIAITEDRIYVTDTGNERVQVFTWDGTFITAFGGFGEGDGQFVEPTGIAIAPDGSIWVADSGNARLQQFNADGTFIASHDMPEWENQLGIARLNMLAFDDNGVLYYTMPTGGVMAWRDGETVPLMNTLSIVAGGITFDENGNMLVTDTVNAEVIRFVPELPGDWLPPGATPEASPAASPAATPAN